MLNVAFIRSVGHFKWFSRYSRLQFRKRLLKVDSRLRLPTGTWMVIPRHSASAGEAYVTNGDIDWGSEALLTRFADVNHDFQFRWENGLVTRDLKPSGPQFCSARLNSPRKNSLLLLFTGAISVKTQIPFGNLFPHGILLGAGQVDT